jgi:4-amino-4-deoxy-L-arabinose transferase-like glycosyltransferase
MALQETPATFFLVLAFCLMCYGRPSETGGTPVSPATRRWAWFAGAGACAALAVTVKATAAIALPAFVVGVWAVDKAQRRAAVMAVCGGMAAVLAAYAVVWYAPHHHELARMGAYYARHQYLPHSAVSLWLNVRRGLVGDAGGAFRGVVPYLMAMALVPFGVGILAPWRKNRRSPTELAMVVWWVCGIVLCLLSSYAPSRYYVLFLPTLAGVSAIRLAQMTPKVRAAAVCLFAAMSCGWLSWTYLERTSNLIQAQEALAQALAFSPGSGFAPGCVIIGDFAPVVCLGTSFRAAPVQPGLSNDDHPVERLHASYVAVTRAPVWRNWWREHYPDLAAQGDETIVLKAGANREYTVDIYPAPVANPELGL